MQEVRHDGTEGEPRPFNRQELEASLEDPNIKYVKVFKLRPGAHIHVPDIGTFKVTAVRPNGKVTMRMKPADKKGGQK